MPYKMSDPVRKEEKRLKRILQSNLVAIRKSKNLTQAMMAEALGISRETYSNYEGRTIPPHFVISKLAKVYNVSPGVFYSENLNVTTLFVENDNDTIYGESRFTDLTDFEKLTLMKFRQLNKSDKEKISKMIDEKLKEV